MLRFSLASSLRLFAGGHRGVVTPVPIPNTEVKGSFAEGSAGLARARVGRRRLFSFLRRMHPHSSNGKSASPIGRTPLATASRLTAFGGYSGFFLFIDLERLATPRPAWEKHPVLQVFFFYAWHPIADAFSSCTHFP